MSGLDKCSCGHARAAHRDYQHDCRVAHIAPLGRDSRFSDSCERFTDPETKPEPRVVGTDD